MKLKTLSEDAIKKETLDLHVNDLIHWPRPRGQNKYEVIDKWSVSSEIEHHKKRNRKCKNKGNLRGRQYIRIVED